MAATDADFRFALLAPLGARGLLSRFDVTSDITLGSRLFDEMQRLRGRIAVSEGAISISMLDSSGRHAMPGDEKSWHLLRIRGNRKVAGCARILVHPRDVGFPQLRIASSSVARCTDWAWRVKDAIETELASARLRGLTPIEPGGWVVDADLRGTREAFSLAIGAFALARILGGCMGFLTATEKNGSSAMLRRLGGSDLKCHDIAIPGYFEPAWGCNMELLRFDTNSLNPRFESALESARCQLLTSPVFAGAVH
jgi:hypothetical protein